MIVNMVSSCREYEEGIINTDIYEGGYDSVIVSLGIYRVHNEMEIVNMASYGGYNEKGIENMLIWRYDKGGGNLGRLQGMS